MSWLQRKNSYGSSLSLTANRSMGESNFITFKHISPHNGGKNMFDHVKFGVSDYPSSKAFYINALKPLGITGASEWPPNGVELYHPEGEISLCLYQTDEKPAHLHVAFVAENRQQVDAFYRAALDAGGKDNGPPGLRPEYNATYYAAFVLCPDGHNIEAVCHKAEA